MCPIGLNGQVSYENGDLDPHIFLGDPLVKMGWYDPARIYYPSRKGAGDSIIIIIIIIIIYQSKISRVWLQCCRRLAACAAPEVSITPLRQPAFV